MRAKTGTWAVDLRFWGAYVGLHEDRGIGLSVVVPEGRGPTDAAPAAAAIWSALLSDGAAGSIRVTEIGNFSLGCVTNAISPPDLLSISWMSRSSISAST